MHHTQILYTEGLIKVGRGNLNKGIRKVSRETGYAESYIRRPINGGEPYVTKGVPATLMDALFNPTVGLLFQ